MDGLLTITYILIISSVMPGLPNKKADKIYNHSREKKTIYIHSIVSLIYIRLHTFILLKNYLKIT